MAQAILLKLLTYIYCAASNGNEIMHKELEKIMKQPWQNFKALFQRFQSAEVLTA
jgi:hypothetical protein